MYTMLRFQLETEIQKPIEDVTRLFANRALLTKWQPGLLSSEQTETYPHPTYKLKFDFGRRKMVMTETILRNELPSHFEGTYEMKGIFNRIHNTFETTGPRSTKWTYTTEFRFSGLMKIISFFMKDGFRKQSEVIMKNFKKFAEHA
jgi:hypothetical protein